MCFILECFLTLQFYLFIEPLNWLGEFFHLDFKSLLFMIWWKILFSLKLLLQPLNFIGQIFFLLLGLSNFYLKGFFNIVHVLLGDLQLTFQGLLLVGESSLIRKWWKPRRFRFIGWRCYSSITVGFRKLFIKTLRYPQVVLDCFDFPHTF